MIRSISLTASRLAVAGLSLFLAWSCAAEDTNGVGTHKNMKNSRVDHALTELHDQFMRHKESDRDAGQFESTNKQLHIVDGYVVVDAVAADDIAELEEDLRLLGATHLSTYGGLVSCLLPIRNIIELAALDSLKFARPAYAITRPDTDQAVPLSGEL